MFSDGEARRLAQLEALLWADDPDFIQRFDASWQEAQRRRLPPWVLWVYVPVVVLALVVDNALLAIAAACLTWVVTYLWGFKPSSVGTSSRRRGAGPRRPRP